MKKFISLLILFSLIYTPIQPADKKPKTTTANTAAISIDLPTIPIHNNSAKKAQVTSITILYKIPGEETTKSITTSTKTIIPKKRGKTFALKLSLPATSDTPQSAEYHGVSELKIFDDIIKFTKPWTGLTGSETIFIKNVANKWVLDHEAMKKSAENKKQSSKKPKSKTITPAHTSNEPTLSSKKPKPTPHMPHQNKKPKPTTKQKPSNPMAAAMAAAKSTPTSNKK